MAKASIRSNLSQVTEKIAVKLTQLPVYIPKFQITNRQSVCGSARDAENEFTTTELASGTSRLSSTAVAANRHMISCLTRTCLLHC